MAATHRLDLAVEACRRAAVRAEQRVHAASERHEQARTGAVEQVRRLDAVLHDGTTRLEAKRRKFETDLQQSRVHAARRLQRARWRIAGLEARCFVLRWRGVMVRIGILVLLAGFAVHHGEALLAFFDNLLNPWDLEPDPFPPPRLEPWT